MKDIVIISIYDSFYYASIMIDGKVIEKEEKDRLLFEIENIYYNNDFEEGIKEKFKDKTIIICENGGVDVLWLD